MVIGSVKEFMADWGLLNTQDMSSKFYFIVSLLWVNQTILWCFFNTLHIHYIHYTHVLWDSSIRLSAKFLKYTSSANISRWYLRLRQRVFWSDLQIAFKKTYPLINVQLCHHLFTIAFAMALLLMCRLCDMCIYEISW